MDKETFTAAIHKVTIAIAEKPLNMDLASDLNNLYPPGSDVFTEIQQTCEAGIKQGWMCGQEFGGIKFGRVIKEVNGYSVDVVHMTDVVGPHHRHPKGEIDLIMPINGNAEFDNHGAGWIVYEPNSAHNPTVKNGTALVLYLLPGGEIEFTRQ
jgi:hypothetical protein|tara:strand:+ start:483 stop:941 length:459 start_codon:yes stop_codon:yes gene_type:complete